MLMMLGAHVVGTCQSERHAGRCELSIATGRTPLFCKTTRRIKNEETASKRVHLFKAGA